MQSTRYSHTAEVPLALAVFLASDNYDYNDDPHTISATTLLKPLRQLILATRVPPGQGLVPLPDMMKNRMGAAIHDAIERAWKTNHQAAMLALGYPQKIVNRIAVNPSDDFLVAHPDSIPVYLEQRLHRKLGKWTISGKFDFIGEGRVQDFKSTSVWTYQNQVNNNKYALQGSIYRWLDPKLITQNEMDIHFIFTDWQRSKIRSDPNYPSHPFKKQSFALKSVQEIEAFISKKLALMEKYWNADEADIPLCEDEDLWRSDPVFKYYKNPEKLTGRSTKNFDNKHDAMLRFVEDGSKGVVLEKPGEVTACKYCPAFPVCTQKDALIAAGDLLMDS
jgi:hypothetical protein